MTFENIIVETRGRVGLITLNRPQALNALNSALIADLNVALATFESDTGIGCIVITGSEKAFAAGADIKEMQSKSYMDVYMGDFIGSWERITTCRKPVVAAVAGFALGGGCELALACHMRFASENAKLGLPEVGLGIIPGYGGTQRLPRLIGLGRALELICSGRMIDAAEAHRIGLVNAVLPQADLLAHCEKVAGDIVAKGPIAVRFAMDAAIRGLETDLDHGLVQESVAFGLLSATEDMREGLRAFLEKRKPAFTGK